MKVQRVRRLGSFLIVARLAVPGSVLHAQDGHNAQPAVRVAQLTAAEWRQDIDSLASAIRQSHPNPWRVVTPAHFDSVVAAARAATASRTPSQNLLALAAIAALPGDGHTGLWPESVAGSGFEFLPVRFYWYGDGLHIQAAAPEFGQLAGAKVIRIGKVSAEAAIDAARSVIGADNEYGVRDFTPYRLVRPAFLHAAGIIDSPDSVRLVVAQRGVTQEITLRPLGLTASGEARTGGIWMGHGARAGSGWVDAAAPSAPLWLQHQDSAFIMRLLPESNAVYIRLNELSRINGQTPAALIQRALAAGSAAGVRVAVLDLRMNGGGDNSLAPGVVRAIVKSPFDSLGRLQVLIGRRTFSAAQNLVNQIERYTLATFVGEPTGARPNHSGEAQSVLLPRSGLTARISTLYFQDVSPRDRRSFTAPSLAAELTSEDYAKGRDPVLELALSPPDGSAFEAQLRSAVSRNDSVGAVRLLQERLTNPVYRFSTAAPIVNRVGYALLPTDPRGAVLLFRINVVVHPAYLNGWDSLASTLLERGDRPGAAAAYRELLRRDPNNESARRGLQAATA